MIPYSLFLGLALLALGVLVFRRWRIWVLYFLVGGIGAALIGVYLFHTSGLEILYRSFLTKVIYWALAAPPWLKVFPESGMFLFRQQENWVAFQMDVECLGFIEIMVFAGLLIFYPAMRKLTRLKYLFGGVFAIYVINILRVLLIVGMVRYGGLGYTYLSHTVVARLFFFLLVIGIYWHVFTVETIKQFKELGEAYD